MDYVDDRALGDENLDPLPWDEALRVTGPDKTGATTAQFTAFSSPMLIQVYGGNASPSTIQKTLGAARDDCRAFERLFSRFLPHSDISRLNQAHGQPVSIHEYTYDLLEKALHYCALSRGTFDITIGAASALWDFGRGVIPDPTQLKAACISIDWRNLELSRDAAEGPQARLCNPHATVDVGGVAKGWIADQLARRFDDAGFLGYILNLGGNVLVRGKKPDGSLWKVGVRDPQHPDKLAGSLTIPEGSLVTSGIYERSFTRNGVFYHHILSPKTGYPVDTDVAGATVLAHHSLDAEGFSTTLMALGTDEALAFAATQPAILQAVLIDREGQVKTLV